MVKVSESTSPAGTVQVFMSETTVSVRVEGANRGRLSYLDFDRSMLTTVLSALHLAV